MTIELSLLKPGEDYWLSLNAAFPDSPENTIIGGLKDPDWPEGGFYKDPQTGKKEGFWDFATITANRQGTFRGTFLLPLPPREDAYSVKLLVKEIHAGGDVIIQAPFIVFVVDRSFTIWVWAAVGFVCFALTVCGLRSEWRKTIFRRFWNVLRKIKETLGVVGPEPESNAPLRIEQWEDLGIGIDDEGKYLAITPCPHSGAVVRAKRKRAVELSLPGKQWEELLKLLAKSTHGNSAQEHDLLVKFGYFRPGGHSIEEIRGDLASMKIVSHAHKDLTRAIADLNKRLRRHVNVRNPDSGPPLSAAKPGKVRSLFVVRYLLRDHNGRIHFGKAE